MPAAVYKRVAMSKEAFEPRILCLTVVQFFFALMLSVLEETLELTHSFFWIKFREVNPS